MYRLCFLFILFVTPLFAVKIIVVNDSAYVLHGIVKDADGVELGGFEISPGHTHNWFDSRHNAQDYVKGPFTIDLICPGGGSYGTIRRVTENRTVRVRSARGPRTCRKADQPEAPLDRDALAPHYKNRYYQHHN